MAYCTKDEVQATCKELQRENVDAKIDEIIAESDRIVNADLSGIKEIYQISNYNPVPDTLKSMAIYKAREIGYRVYYGKVPDGTEIQYYQNEYASLLKSIRERLSKIDDNMDTDTDKVEFV